MPRGVYIRTKPIVRTKPIWNKGLHGVKTSDKGQIPWNKGLVGVMPTPWNKGIHTGIKPWLGKKRPYIKGHFVKGQPAWNKGKHHLQKENHPLWKGGKPDCIDCGKRLSAYHVIRCNKCQLGHRGMSLLEKRVEKVINKYNLPYKFVGDGKFYIERKCPDFINTNGEKKAVEVFWQRHKEQFAGGLENWKKERIEIFGKYGWEIIFLEGTGLTNDRIIEILMKGGD